MLDLLKKFQPETPSTVIIDLEAIQHNYLTICKHLDKKTECAPAVKANGYGLGMVPVSQALWETGARTFFVVQTQEGVELRKSLPHAQIYVLSTLVDADRDTLAEYQLTPVLCNLDQLHRWHQKAIKAQKRLPCAIHIDTGMVRTGFHEHELKNLPAPLFEFLDLKLIMSHLACPYSPEHPMNEMQLQRFEDLSSYIPKAALSLANSGGIHLGSQYHFDVVRPGLSLYGSQLTSSEFRPVAHIYAQIVQIEDVPQGTAIGYDATFTTELPSRIATLAIGYADGLLRTLSNNGYVFANGQRFPMVGRISMDLMTIDVTEDDKLKCGDWVEIMGANISLDEVATWAGTAPWEILTNLGSRYSRIYAKKSQLQWEKVAS